MDTAAALRRRAEQNLEPRALDGAAEQLFEGTEHKESVFHELSIDENGHVALPEGLTEVPEQFFLDCTELRSVALPSSLTRIGRNAFESCYSLAALQLPERLLRISSGACCGCTSLETIAVPASVTTIGDHAFRDCFSASFLHFEEDSKLKEIGWNAFQNTAIHSLVLPESLRKIGSFAFDGCSQLAHVTVPSATEISPHSFPPTTRVTRRPPRRKLLEKAQYMETFHGRGYLTARVRSIAPVAYSYKRQHRVEVMQGSDVLASPRQ